MRSVLRMRISLLRTAVFFLYSGKQLGSQNVRESQCATARQLQRFLDLSKGPSISLRRMFQEAVRDTKSKLIGPTIDFRGYSEPYRYTTLLTLLFPAAPSTCHCQTAFR
jgi:hypothetical protein